jgi:rhodanese-related sulfurtransferase
VDVAAERLSISDVLAAARLRINRLTATEAHAAMSEGAELIDVRSEDEQRSQGVLIPGAVHHPLSVVAWRLDPDVPTRNQKLPLSSRVVLICREGYSSSLAACWLQTIGFAGATDVIGGVDAWVASRLPVEPYRDRSSR